MNRIVYLVLFLAIFGCQSDIVESEKATQVWVDVYGRYLEGDQQYKFEATFLKGDTLPAATIIEPQGSLMIGGHEMKARQLSEELIRCFADFTGPYQAVQTLQLDDPEINFKSLRLNLPQTPAFSIAEAALSKATGGSLYLEEELEIKTGESLLVLISDPEKQAAKVEIPGPIKIKEIIIPAVQVQALNIGQGDVYLVYKRLIQNPPVDNVTVKGELEYYSLAQSLEIAE